MICETQRMVNVGLMCLQAENGFTNPVPPAVREDGVDGVEADDHDSEDAAVGAQDLEQGGNKVCAESFAVTL